MALFNAAELMARAPTSPSHSFREMMEGLRSYHR
jgi:hypothetical protein